MCAIFAPPLQALLVLYIHAFILVTIGVWRRLRPIPTRARLEPTSTVV